MKCENDFCIYCKRGECNLSEISIDSLGTCECCILISLDDETLQHQKEILLEKYEMEI